MTGWELIAALRRLPNDALEQDVVFIQKAYDALDEEYYESIIIDSIQPFAKVADINGNVIKLS